jgi:uncharacterized protein (TIGR03435 family)
MAMNWHRLCGPGIVTGLYDVDLEWTPESLKAPNPPNQTTQVVDLATPSLFAAVREQLGLKLEARRDPLDAAVVDHAERVPAAN